VVTDGYGDLTSPDMIAFSGDSRRVAFSVKQQTDKNTRLYWGTPGLLSGWSGRPSVGLWATRRKSVTIYWAGVSAPQEVHKIRLPEVTLDSSTHVWEGLRQLAFNSDASCLAALDAQRLVVIRLSDGRLSTWRGANLSHCTWVKPDRLAVLACEAGQGGPSGECVAVTYHIAQQKGALSARRVQEQSTQEFDGTPASTAYFINVIWSPEGIPEKIGSGVCYSRVKVNPPSIPDPPKNAIETNRMICLWPSPPPPCSGRAMLRLERAISPDGHWFCAATEFPDCHAQGVFLVDLTSLPFTGEPKATSNTMSGTHSNEPR